MLYLYFQFFNMSITRVFLYILLAIFLYKFVVNFLVPIVKMSWKVRRQIKDFQRQHQEQNPMQGNAAQTSATQQSTAKKPKSGDYIDFEEVKD